MLLTKVQHRQHKTYLLRSFGIVSLWFKIYCNTPTTSGLAVVTPDSFIGLDCFHIPILVFSVHFVLTHAHLGNTFRSVTHPQIAPSKAHLT
jgi:hypothetical protein